MRLLTIGVGNQDFSSKLACELKLVHDWDQINVVDFEELLLLGTDYLEVQTCKGGFIFKICLMLRF